MRTRDFIKLRFCVYFDDAILTFVRATSVAHWTASIAGNLQPTDEVIDSPPFLPLARTPILFGRVIGVGTSAESRRAVLAVVHFSPRPWSGASAACRRHCRTTYKGRPLLLQLSSTSTSAFVDYPHTIASSPRPPLPTVPQPFQVRYPCSPRTSFEGLSRFSIAVPATAKDEAVQCPGACCAPLRCISERS